MTIRFLLAMFSVGVFFVGVASPSANADIEPNGNLAFAEFSVDDGSIYSGSLGRDYASAKSDVYAIYLAGPGQVSITINETDPESYVPCMEASLGNQSNVTLAHEELYEGDAKTLSYTLPAGVHRYYLQLDSLALEPPGINYCDRDSVNYSFAVTPGAAVVPRDPPAFALMSEPNDSFGRANHILPGVQYFGQKDTRNDRDIGYFFVKRNVKKVKLEATGAGPANSGCASGNHIEIFDPRGRYIDGEIVDEGFWSAGAFRPRRAGRYYVRFASCVGVPFAVRAITGVSAKPPKPRRNRRG